MRAPCASAPDDLGRGWKAAAWLIVDGLAERAATLYSHHSFRGRRTPNPGQVRPPNMSKSEWYGRPESLSDPRKPPM